MYSRGAMLIHAQILNDLLVDMRNHINKAYVGLIDFRGEHRYTISTFNLSMAHSSYIQFKVYYQSNSLVADEIESILESFIALMSEFDKAIIRKTETARRQLINDTKIRFYEDCREAEDFLNNHISVNSY